MDSDNIRNGAETALIDSDFKSIPNFKPQLIVNDGEIRIVDYIREELAGCDEFMAKPFKVEALIEMVKKYLDK